MSQLLNSVTTGGRRSEALRLAALTAFTIVLALAFLVLLISDEVQAAAR